MVNKRLEKLIVSPAVWPGRNLRVQPGDLTQFAPYGNGVYGFQTNTFEPIKSDPPQEPSGGFVYFKNDVNRVDFEGFLRMMEVRADRKDYAAFVSEATDPLKERYFKQIRIISRFGLRFMFDALDDKEYDKFKEQELLVGEALWEFMEAERKRFGTNFGDPRIEGRFGGDGNFAREELAFGFMVENSYHALYRIWSRAWLVTK